MDDEHEETEAEKLFNSIASLVRGAEEHVAAIEREACCAVARPDKRTTLVIIGAASQHLDTARRFCDAAVTYHHLLDQLAESTGDDAAKELWVKSEPLIEKADDVEARAAEVYAQMKAVFEKRKDRRPACRMGAVLAGVGE